MVVRQKKVGSVVGKSQRQASLFSYLHWNRSAHTSGLLPGENSRPLPSSVSLAKDPGELGKNGWSIGDRHQSVRSSFPFWPHSYVNSFQGRGPKGILHFQLHFCRCFYNGKF